MEQLPLFKLPNNFNNLPQWSQVYPDKVMDKFANLNAMNWRDEIKRRNHELKYKSRK